MLSTLFSRKTKTFLDQATISSNLAKAKALQSRVEKFFNLEQFIELFKITSELQDSIGITDSEKMSESQLDLFQTLIIWGRNKEGMNQTPIGYIPNSNSIYLGGTKHLPLHTLNHYSTEMVRDIDFMFLLKEHYQPILKETIELLISNLEKLDQK